jgi:alginate production protein
MTRGDRAGTGWRAAAAGVLRASALAVVLGTGVPPPAAAEAAGTVLQMVALENSPREATTLERQRPLDPGPVIEPSSERAAFETGLRLAQFQLPSAEPETGKPPRTLVRSLRYQYGYGSESSVEYRRDPDLNNRMRDNSRVVTPQLNGIITYRPTDWLETTLEMIIEREVAREEPQVLLPNGETRFAQRRRVSIPVDQAFVLIRDSPMEFAAGRRNYEDDRHWLWDTSLDIASIAAKQGAFRLEAFGGREVQWDLDLAPHQRQARDRIDTYVLYADYRGIEDHKLAAYTIVRDDRTLNEGRPRLVGVRALGAPSNNFNYWVDLATLGGTDELRQKVSAAAVDVGGTYRFSGLPLAPSITLGYAFATGDGNPNDGRNKEFRQSGLQSNEIKLGGIPKFKIYGEVLDPELSNLEIVTLGLGIRPAPDVSLELVYHRYRLDKLADAIRTSALTAVMNQDDTQLSKYVGRELDIVLGFRNVFGIRRLGVDVRAGRFYPGKAFRIEEGDPADPTFRPADKGYAVVAKIWW